MQPVGGGGQRSEGEGGSIPRTTPFPKVPEHHPLYPVGNVEPEARPGLRRVSPASWASLLLVPEGGLRARC